MASPKFRRLDYPLYEALMRAKVSGSTYQILLVVIDQTIGYRRETAPISLSKFTDKTSLSRQGVIKAIKDAERRDIISVSRNDISAKKPASYTINIDYAEWLTSKPKLTSISQRVFTNKPVNGSLPDQSTVVYQTSQQLTPATPRERKYKVSIKERGTEGNNESDINISSLSKGA